MILYHVTSLANLASIAETGLRPLSYWTSNENLAHYYAGTIEDEGGQPVWLTLNLDQLEAYACSPDRPGLEEPITTVLGMTEDEVWEQWVESGCKWMDSLRIIGSLRYHRVIPAELLKVDAFEGCIALKDYLDMQRQHA